MKTILTFFLVAISILSMAQNVNSKCKVINNQIDLINKELASYSMVRIDFTTPEIDSAYREVYSDKHGVVVLLTLNNSVDTGHQVVKYYFNEEQFVCGSQSHYSNNGTLRQEQFYLEENKLIEWIDADGEFKDKTSDDYSIFNQGLADYACSLVVDFKEGL